MSEKKSLTYAEAGVDVEAGNVAVQLMKDKVRASYRPEVVGDLGGFAGIFRLPDLRAYQEPVLLSGADGVGTKIWLAIQTGIHHTVGQDLVAMCVNDILVQGAEPLFFLDYIACSRVIPEQIATIVGGIASACQEAGCALIGGETAEHGDLMGEGEYDLGGFTVGIADLPKLIDGTHIAADDLIIGLPSSGLHSNGFSLVRRIIKESRLDLNAAAPWQPEHKAGESLLTPTRLYVKPILKLLHQLPDGVIKGMVHITGGGFLENLPRVLPSRCSAEITLGSWPVPPVFAWLQEQGNIAETEMFRTFNNGIGYMLIVSPDEAEQVESVLDSLREPHYRIGRIVAGAKDVALVRP